MVLVGLRPLLPEQTRQLYYACVSQVVYYENTDYSWIVHRGPAIKSLETNEPVETAGNRNN